MHRSLLAGTRRHVALSFQARRGQTIHSNQSSRRLAPRAPEDSWVSRSAGVPRMEIVLRISKSYEIKEPEASQRPLDRKVCLPIE